MHCFKVKIRPTVQITKAGYDDTTENIFSFYDATIKQYLIFCFSRCVRKLLYHVQKTSKLSKACFTTTQNALAPLICPTLYIHL